MAMEINSIYGSYTGSYANSVNSRQQKVCPAAKLVMGGIIMSICGIVMGGKVSGFNTASTAMLVYLALVSAVAYSLWGILLKYNPISRVAVFGFITPVFGVVLSALFLPGENQALGMKSIAALILVCAGIYVVNHARPEK